MFEKYNLDDKSMLCLWRNGHLSCALHDSSGKHELQTRLTCSFAEKQAVPERPSINKF